MDTIVHKYCTYLSSYVRFIVLKNQYGWLPSVSRMGQQCVVAEEWRGTQADIQLGDHTSSLLMCVVLALFPGAEEGAGTRLVWYSTLVPLPNILLLIAP